MVTTLPPGVSCPKLPRVSIDLSLMGLLLSPVVEAPSLWVLGSVEDRAPSHRPGKHTFLKQESDGGQSHSHLSSRH